MAPLAEQYEDDLVADEYRAMGKALAELFLLRRKPSGRYVTDWGDKTAFGLVRCVEAIMEIDGYKFDRE